MSALRLLIDRVRVCWPKGEDDLTDAAEVELTDLETYRQLYDARVSELNDYLDQLGSAKAQLTEFEKARDEMRSLASSLSRQLQEFEECQMCAHYVGCHRNVLGQPSKCHVEHCICDGILRTDTIEQYELPFEKG